MRARTRARIVPLMAILAAALGGCQTADTGPNTASLRLAMRLSAPQTAAVQPQTLQPAGQIPEPADPHVALASHEGKQLSAPTTTEDASGPPPTVADFTVATTVPGVHPSTGSTIAAPPIQQGGVAAPETPHLASAPAEPGGLGSQTDPTAMPMTLDAAIATSLDRNPTLVSLRAGEPVARAVLDVAEHYPFNPFVQVEVIPYAREITGELAAVKHYVYLMQTLELAHQQRYRESSAMAALNQVRWNIVAAELTNTATTEKLYFTALYQRDLRDLARRAAELNEQLAGVVEGRFKANLSKPGEETTARVSLRQSHKQAALAEANYAAARLTLMRQLNLPSDQTIDLVGRLEDFAWNAIEGMGPTAGQSFDSHVPIQLIENLAGERPDVRAAQAGANVAQSNAELARANVTQNLQVGPYYERDELGTVFLGLRAQMNIPVWDSGRPLARQREAECAQQVVNLNELRARAHVEVQTALDRYERARYLAVRERSDFLQSLSGDLARIKRQFEVGQADILNVFATQTALLAEQRAYLDLLNELAQSAADVTLVAGLPPARIISGRRPADAPGVPAPPAP
ncbi:MAG TPA: TolC family protein [Planctomycetaceae bacterium]|nr:TolC family protein [Planctomycetaceae bacterium]